MKSILIKATTSKFRVKEISKGELAPLFFIHLKEKRERERGCRWKEKTFRLALITGSRATRS